MPQHLNKYCYGVTGTRNPPENIDDIVFEWIQSLPAGSTIYHGGCVGVDAVVARLAWQAGHKVIAVLPILGGQIDRDSWQRWSHFVIYAPMGVGSENDYRARNKLLVHQLYKRGGLLKAFWNGRKRSGTSMTINIAKGEQVPVEIEELP